MAIDAFCGFMRVSPTGDTLEGIALGMPPGESVPPSAAELLWRPIPLDGDSLLAMAVRSRATLLTSVSGASIDAAYADEADRAEARRFEPKGVMFVPVFISGVVRGVLAMFRRGSCAVPFEDDDRLFAERLAEYAAIALANAELLRDANERASRMQLLSNLGRDAAAAAHDYQRLLDVIARHIGAAMADSCVLRVQSAEGDFLSGFAVYHQDPEIEAFHRATLASVASDPAPLSHRTLATNQSVLLGFTGELLESEAPRRAVTTERMIGIPGPATRNELTLTPRPGDRTQIKLRITYPSREIRDMVLGTGMVNGMEASYARLEQTLSGRARRSQAQRGMGTRSRSARQAGYACSRSRRVAASVR